MPRVVGIPENGTSLSHLWVVGNKFKEAIDKRDRVMKTVNHVNSGFQRGKSPSGRFPRGGGRGRNCGG